MNRERLVTTAFSAVADALTEELDLPDLLQALVDRAALLSGAAAAGVYLDDQRGGLQLCSSSTHAPGAQQLLAMAAEGGPCLEAFTMARAVSIDREQPSKSWRIAQMMDARELSAVHATPLRVRHHVVGSLGLFFADGVALHDDDLAAVAALSRVASLGFLHERGGDHRELIAAQLHSALRVRVLVEQAKGVVAETLHISVAEAFVLLIAHAHRHDMPIAEAASRLLDGSLVPLELRGPPDHGSGSTKIDDSRRSR